MQFGAVAITPVVMMVIVVMVVVIVVIITTAITMIIRCARNVRSQEAALFQNNGLTEAVELLRGSIHQTVEVATDHRGIVKRT